MKLFGIIHKETGLTLRQYAKLHEIACLTPDGSTPHPYEFKHESLEYVISQKGTPGFYYPGYEGVCLWWLPSADWEVRWNVDALAKNNVPTVIPPMSKDKDDADVCSVDGEPHVPDWASLSTEMDGDVCYVDVNCRKCGRSGCVGTHKTLADGIGW